MKVLTRYKKLSALAGVVLFSSLTCSGAGEATLVGPSAAGLGKYLPDQWSLVTGQVKNPDDQPAQFIAKQVYPDSQQVQFGRQITVPSQSSRRFWLPVVPCEPKAGELSVEVKGELIAGDDVNGAVIGETIANLRLASDSTITAVLEDSKMDIIHQDMLYALRESVGLKRRLSFLVESKLPRTPEGWNIVHSLLINKDHVNLGAEQISSLRQWLFAGGRLWVMADQVEPAFMAQLLGDAWTLEVIDHVALLDFTIKGQSVSEEKHFEQPIEMVRVIAPGAKVLHDVSGWPASMIFDFGLGQVLVTTIDSKAWTVGEREMMKPTEILVELGHLFFKPTAIPQVADATLAGFVGQQAGGTHAGILLYIIGATAVVLIIIAVKISAKANAYGRLKWMVPLIIIVAGAAIFLINQAGKSGAEPMLTGVQIICTSPQQDNALVTGRLAGFNPKQATLTLKASDGGVAYPVGLSGNGRSVDIIWSSLDNWTLTAETPSSGTMFFDIQKVIELDKPIAVRYGSDGMVAGFSGGSLMNPTDMLIVTPTGRYPATLENDGSLTVAMKPLAEGQSGASNQGDPLHQHREKVVADVSASLAANGQTAVIAWVDPMDLSMDMQPSVRSEVKALAVVILD